MYQVDEKPETIHLYVVREREPRPSLLPLFFAVLCLAAIVGVTVYSGYHPYCEHERLTIPAQFLPLKSFTASAPIIPTGIQTYPATSARGTLTLTNGSVISQELPKGLIFTGKDGIEIVTDTSVFVSAGSVSGYGFATVSAQAVVSGTQGNIAALSINAVYGTSLYIRNLTAFHGGENAYSVKIVTPQDRQTAIYAARAILATQQAQIKAFLAYPCKETALEKSNVVGLSKTCQYVTYSVPSFMKVSHVRVEGKNLLIEVVFVERPRRIWVK